MGTICGKWDKMDALKSELESKPLGKPYLRTTGTFRIYIVVNCSMGHRPMDGMFDRVEDPDVGFTAGLTRHALMRLLEGGQWSKPVMVRALSSTRSCAADERPISSDFVFPA